MFCLIQYFINIIKEDEGCCREEVCLTPGKVCFNITEHSHITLTVVGLAVKGHFMFVKAQFQSDLVTFSIETQKYVKISIQIECQKFLNVVTRN